MDIALIHSLNLVKVLQHCIKVILSSEIMHLDEKPFLLRVWLILFYLHSLVGIIWVFSALFGEISNEQKLGLCKYSQTSLNNHPCKTATRLKEPFPYNCYFIREPLVYHNQQPLLSPKWKNLSKSTIKNHYPAKKWEVVIYSFKYLEVFFQRPLLYQKILWTTI